MQHQTRKHADPWKQMEKTGFFSGKQSTVFWNSINAFKKHCELGDNSIPALTWDALYTIGCRLQDFESFVRRKLEELNHSPLNEKLLKEGTLCRNDAILRLFYGIPSKDIKALQKSHNRRKGKK